MKNEYPIGSKIDEFGSYFGVWPATVTGRTSDGYIEVLQHVRNLAGRVVDIPARFHESAGPDIRPKEARSVEVTHQQRRSYTVNYMTGRRPDDPIFEKLRPDGTAGYVGRLARSPRDYDGKQGLPWHYVRGRYWPIGQGGDAS